MTTPRGHVMRAAALGCAAVATMVVLAGCNPGRAGAAGSASPPAATSSADPLAGYESTVSGIERDVDSDAGAGR